MACNYKIIINGIDSGFGSERMPILLASSSDQVQNYSIEQLIQDLGKLSKSQLNSLIELIDKAEENYKKLNSDKTIKSTDKKIAIDTLINHLSGLGVTVIGLDRDDPKYKYKNSDAYTENGVIYVCYDSDITAPMHEMMHLVFGVLKAKDFQKYNKIMNMMSSTSIFLEIYKNISKKEEYSNMMELDKKEEAFIRLFESIYNDEIDIDDLKVKGANIYDQINRMLIPYIQQTFGVEEVKSMIQFFKDSISNLPLEGSTIFMRPKISTVGYSDYKDLIVIYNRITNLIQLLSKPDKNGNSIIKENC